MFTTHHRLSIGLWKLLPTAQLLESMQTFLIKRHFSASQPVDQPISPQVIFSQLLIDIMKLMMT